MVARPAELLNVKLVSGKWPSAGRTPLEAYGHALAAQYGLKWPLTAQRRHDLCGLQSMVK
jgi:hypothetical protein